MNNYGISSVRLDAPKVAPRKKETLVQLLRTNYCFSTPELN